MSDAKVPREAVAAARGAVTGNTLSARLRRAAGDIRRKSFPLSDLIPLLQEAADALDATPPKGESRDA